MLCYCGSQKDYEQCCKPICSKIRYASTPSELMRARYSAYATGNGLFLYETNAIENRYEEDIELIEEHSKTSNWTKLSVLKEREDGDEGLVEFKAYYKENDIYKLLHEISQFKKIEGQWFYTEGKLFDTKIGRNEPCPCNSGKKFKRCCA